jgi:trimethylamine---corrinoid protein Co-methyltransferase
MRRESMASETRGLHLQLLSDGDLRRLHGAALEVLWQVGARVHEPGSLQTLRSAGCPIEGNLVRLPAALVEDAIASAPESITLHRRDRGEPLNLEGDRTYFGTGSDLPNVLDLDTGERRPARLADVEAMAQVADALAGIDFIMSMALPSDVPAERSDRYSFRAMVTNSAKPVVYTAWDLAGARDIVAMAEVVAGGEEALRRAPTLLAYLEPSSPLKHSRTALEKLAFLAGRGLPYVYAPGAIAGATAPATLAGTLVQCAAEALLGLALGQLCRRGSPFLWGSSASPLDMRTMVNAYVAPEDMLHNTAMAELARRFYHLPSWGFAGCSDSKQPDIQAGAEGALWVAVAAFAGNNLVHDCGYLESGLTASYEMLLAMDESIRIMRRFRSGVALSDDDLAVAAIAKTGPDGHYLDADHTLRHFRRFWRPRWFDHQNHDRWVADGALDARERLRREARRLLAEHTPAPLSREVIGRLDALVLGNGPA